LQFTWFPYGKILGVSPQSQTIPISQLSGMHFSVSAPRSGAPSVRESLFPLSYFFSLFGCCFFFSRSQVVKQISPPLRLLDTSDRWDDQFANWAFFGVLNPRIPKIM